ncbi:MAG: hypothetical protein ACNS60_02460 [Candidatus Cyclobacteriaceae bacterium M2_1C_046]
MNRTLDLNRSLISFGVPIILLAILILLMKSQLLVGNEILSIAITIDLLLLVPFVYFLLIRKSEIPNTTVVPVMIVGLLIGSYFLPKESQNYLQLFKTWALPVVEVSILIFVVVKVRGAVKEYKALKGSSPDFFNTLKSTCYKILPKKLVLPFATEVAVIYYGFINWKNRRLQENEFSYHKNSGTPALFGVFILLIGIETVALHFLLALWSSLAAWILTGLSLYTAIQVLGFAKSLSQRPISINGDILSLKYGILNEAEISLSDIDHIELSAKPLIKNKLSRALSPLGEIESHNIILHLKKEKELTGLYGMKKKFKIIAFHIDEPDQFKERIENIL